MMEQGYNYLACQDRDWKFIKINPTKCYLEKQKNEEKSLK